MAELRLGLAVGASVTEFGIEGPFTRSRLSDHVLLAGVASGLSVADLGALGSQRIETLDTLHRRQHLAWRVIEAGEIRGTLECLTRELPLIIPEVTSVDAQVGEESLLRRSGRDWLLESSTSDYIATMRTEVALPLVDSRVAPVSHEWMGLLLEAGLLVDPDQPRPRAPWWEFHDRYFISRSSLDIAPAGGTFRLAGTTQPPPLARTDDAEITVVLPEPPEPAGGQRGPAIGQVMASRRTVRDFAGRALRLEDLSLLLDRTMRMRAVKPRDEQRPQSYETGTRAIPSAGGMQSVRLWLWCPGVAGITAGPWRYDPLRHALVGRESAARWPITAWQLSDAPLQGILVVDHARLAWKYARIAYHLGLQDCGVALHALQLAAWAEGLGLHPLGAVPSRNVSRDLGLDPDAEIPVSAFALGWPRDAESG